MKMGSWTRGLAATGSLYHYRVTQHCPHYELVGGAPGLYYLLILRELPDSGSSARFGPSGLPFVVIVLVLK